MSHERTITFEMSGRHFVIPTVIGDHQVDPEEAIRLFRQADEYARERSKNSRRE